MTSTLTTPTNGTAPIASLEWSDEEKKLIKSQIAPGASDNELRLFQAQCRRTGLDPFSRQIYAIMREQWDPATRQKVSKMTIQTSIDGFRVIAQRSGKYAGQEGPYWCGPDGEWKDVWLSDDLPAAAKVLVFHRDFDRPIVGIALFKEYASKKQDGTLIGLWKKSEKPSVMLAKCYTPDTEILTDHGFVRFPDVTDEMRILQVGSSGLEPVEAKPFVQEYHGPMVAWRSKRGGGIDFCVTPNHDMLLTSGEVIEAGDLLNRTTYRSADSIPLTVSSSKQDADVSNLAIKLSAAYLADGFDYNESGFKIAASRDKKLSLLRQAGGFIKESIRQVEGNEAVSSSGRVITTQANQSVFTYNWSIVEGLVQSNKKMATETVLNLSRRQARLFVDTWVFMDGNETKAGTRRVRMARESHASLFEVAAVQAGYSVSERRQRTSDLGFCYEITISTKDAVRVRPRWEGPSKASVGLELQPSNPSGEVWCVTVPTHTIVTRRHGISWVGRQCAEALAFRKAFPNDLSGLYTADEMSQADNNTVEVRVSEVPEAPQVQPARSRRRSAAGASATTPAVTPAEPEAPVDVTPVEAAPAPVAEPVATAEPEPVQAAPEPAAAAPEAPAEVPQTPEAQLLRVALGQLTEIGVQALLLAYQRVNGFTDVTDVAGFFEVAKAQPAAHLAGLTAANIAKLNQGLHPTTNKPLVQVEAVANDPANPFG